MDPAEYEALFEDSTGQNVDASTSYLSSEKALARIKELNSDAKIIISLRNPVKQTWSGFLMMEKFGSRDPHEWLERQLEGHVGGEWMQPIETALYGKYVAKWAAAFDCHVIESEDLRTAPQETFDGICSFLDIDSAPVRELGAAEANVFQTPRSSVAKFLFNNETVAKMARGIMPLSLRQKLGNSLIKPAEKPKMPADWPEKLWPIFEPDLQLLRDTLDRPFSSLGP